MGDAEIDEEEGGLPPPRVVVERLPLSNGFYMWRSHFWNYHCSSYCDDRSKRNCHKDIYTNEECGFGKTPPPLANYNFTEEFRINTSDKGEAHFVKMKLAFGIAKEDQTLSAELAERNAQMRDLINLIVGRKSKDELINIEDQLDLREEIKAQVNHILTEGKIQEVYFTEFIVN